MQHVEGSGTPVLSIGRTVLKGFTVSPYNYHLLHGYYELFLKTSYKILHTAWSLVLGTDVYMAVSPLSALCPALCNQTNNPTLPPQVIWLPRTLLWRSRYAVYNRACASMLSYAATMDHSNYTPISASLGQGWLYLKKADKQPHRSAHSAIQHGDTALRTTERQRRASSWDRCVYEELCGQKRAKDRFNSGR
jgi:hypothetical protein